MTLSVRYSGGGAGGLRAKGERGFLPRESACLNAVRKEGKKSCEKGENIEDSETRSFYERAREIPYQNTIINRKEASRRRQRHSMKKGRREVGFNRKSF